MDTNLSAKSFYSYAVKGILTAKQIFFSARHPFTLCVRKVNHIKNAIRLAAAESFMLEEITTETRMYKFGTTDAAFALCMNPDVGHNGILKSECYVVESLRDEDCFHRAKQVYEVTHIFSRPNDEKLYSRMLYQAPNAVLPESVKDLLNTELRVNTA